MVKLSRGLNSFQSTDDRDVLVFDLGPTPDSAAVWKHVFTNPFDEGWQRARLPLTSAGRTRAPFRESRRFRRSTCSRKVGRSFSWSCCWPCSRSLPGSPINSGLLRDSPPPPDTVKVTGDQLDWTQPPPDAVPYSIGRTQAAWWLFIILAAYILIGLVTGNFATSINSTALTLLGIGAATAVGGVVISQSKNDNQQARDRTLLRRITNLQELGTLKTIAVANRTPVEVSRHAELSRDLPRGGARRARRARRLHPPQRRRLRRRHEPGIERLPARHPERCRRRQRPQVQLFACTIILGVVFVSGVLREVAMPVFSATLLGLMGLSAGTYFGLKIPESTVPKQPPTQP